MKFKKIGRSLKVSAEVEKFLIELEIMIAVGKPILKVERSILTQQKLETSINNNLVVCYTGNVYDHER